MIIMCVQAVTLHTNLGTLKLELFCEQVKAAARSAYTPPARLSQSIASRV